MTIDLKERYRTILTLWFALLMSIGGYFLFTLFSRPEIDSTPGNARNSLLIVALTAVGIFFVVISFAVKRKFLQQSVEKQDVGLVQKGIVIACALCEVSALLGVLEHFVIGNREYYLLFLLAAAGIALHFPRREQLLAATYKTFKGGANF